jgi:arylsulfatase A-like enzyme
MKSRLIFYCSAIFFFTAVWTHCCYGQQKKDSFVTQKINYYTKSAKQLYLVWYLDRKVGLPPEEFWPDSTFKKKGMAWSKMHNVKDSFSIDISLPKNTGMNFMFWVPIDAKGDSTDGWDTYGERTYDTKFKQPLTINLDDFALWMPKKQNSQKKFNILEHGSEFLIVSLLISFVILLALRRKLVFSPLSLIHGFLIFAVLLISVIRMQMNNLFEEKQLLLFGATYPDLIWFFSLGIICIALVIATKKYKLLNSIIVIISAALLSLSIFLSLINIEIVKFLGSPVNYFWLYYSDFMTGSDVKSALSQNLKPDLILQLSLLTASAVIFSFAFSFMGKLVTSKLDVVLATMAVIFIATGIYQNKNITYEKNKIKNPAWELISSIITSEAKPKLFTMEVSKKTKNFIEQYHKQDYIRTYDTSIKINNVVIFVLESTPASLVSTYDSTFSVTPNIKKWRNISVLYNNSYSHLPATVYSMGPMVAGVYPLISYKSMIASYPKNNIPSVISELKKQGWISSMFFGADLTYSNMGSYVKNQGINITEDNATIKCRFKKFGETNTFLDQLDDRCLADNYFKWADSNRDKKKLSILWTIQTHYHYLFRNKEVEYVKDNKDLNKYLNALREDDEVFGMLMEGLKKRNMLNSTLVILTADHGEAFGTHEQIIHASKIYEENIRIPLIMYNPLLFKGELDNTITGLIDIPVTIGNLTGSKKPVEWEGKSLLSRSIGDDRTFFISPFNDLLFGTRSANWKYIYNATTNKEELYDLTTDPKELNNIASNHSNVTKRESEMLAAWVQYHQDKMKNLLKQETK